MAFIPLRRVLSLKEISLRKVSVLIWNQNRNLNLLKIFHLGSKNEGNKLEEWNHLIDEVKILISELELPELLQEELKPFLKPIGYEILKWINFHENYFNSYGDFLDYLYILDWSFDGTINYRKTAENIARYRLHDLDSFYQHSCLFCLENNIHTIWRFISDEEKVICYEKEPSSFAHEGILNYWTSTLSIDFSVPFNCMWVAMLNNCSVYQYAFENSADNGNLVATQYFLPKLMYEERESLMRTAHRIARKINPEITTQFGCIPGECHRDILIYLLTEMSAEESVEMFKAYPREILTCYLDWPRQNMFSQILGRVWSLLHPEDSNFLICMMAKNIDTIAFNYSELLGEFFVNCPLLHTMRILEKQCIHGTFLSALFDSCDIRNIRLILRHVNLYVKEDLFTCNTGFRICLKLLLKSKWGLLDLFIKECCFSEDVSSGIPERFNQFLTRIYTSKQIKSLKYRLNKFFCMVSPIYCAKRKSKINHLKRNKLCRK